MTGANGRLDFASSSRPDERTVRSLSMGTRGAVASGHFLATRAAERVLDLGGNAVDAGVAASVCINVLLFARADFGGVMPMMIYHADTDRIVTLDGVGVWPAAAERSRLSSERSAQEGVLWSVTPGAPDAWLTALARFGTLTLREVLEPACQLAIEGAPVSTGVAAELRTWRPHVEAYYPTTFRAFYPEGRTLGTGEVLRRPELGGVLKAMIEVEARALAQGRERHDAIMEARDLIYRGWVAREIAQHFEREQGWLTTEDLARHQVEESAPLRTTYRGYEIFACGPWSQGPVLLQALNILEHLALAELGHNSPAYLHVLIEALDRAFADRENYYGDPRAVQVPLAGLLSKEYAAARAHSIDLHAATGSMPDPGDPWAFETLLPRPSRRKAPVDVTPFAGVVGVWEAVPRADTSYVAVADSSGSIYSATPSDTAMWSSVIPSLGFHCSMRGQQSRLDPQHSAVMAPGRRPRITPNPAILAVNGQPVVGFGCPGGDIQPQGMLQFVLNLLEFGMNLQQAIEAPRIMSWNFPNSFSPHPYNAGRVDIEGRIAPDVRAHLRSMGHAGVDVAEFDSRASCVHAVAVNTASGVVSAASDPRIEGSAGAW